MSSFVVVGGGIGGLAVALALAQKGHAVTVLEKRDAFSEIGAGLQLAPNALRALAKLGLYEAIRDFAWFPQRLVLGDAQTGQELSTLDLDKTFHTRYGFPYAVMHRADLLDLLYRACVAAGVDLKPGHEVDEFVEESRSVQVICRRGTTLKADAVIAADGLWSRLRSLVSDDAPVQEPYVAYRGTVAVADMGDLVRMDDVVMWIGPGLHFVQYPSAAANSIIKWPSFEATDFVPSTTIGEPRRNSIPLFRRWPPTCNVPRTLCREVVAGPCSIAARWLLGPGGG